MTIHQVEGFCALAKYNNFSQAADSIYLSQSAFSRLIAGLEEDLGCKLYERDKSNPRLSDVGLKLLPLMKRMLEQYTLMQDILEREEKGPGSITVLSFPTGWPREQRDTMAAFHKLYPDIKIVSKIGESDEIGFEKIESGEIEFMQSMYTGDEVKKNFGFVDIGKLQFYVALSDAHPLANKESITIKDLEHERFCMLSRDKYPSLFKKVVDACKAEGFAPNIVHEADNHIMLLDYIITGDCVFITPYTLANLGPKMVPLNIESKSSRAWFWNKNNTNPEAQKFIEFLKNRFEI